MAEQTTWLITGATGFIGRHLTRHLLEDGAHVIALSRNRQKAQRSLGTGPRIIERLDEIGHGEPVTVVVNLAGENLASGRWSRRRMRRFRESRIELTRQLVDWAGERAYPPSVLVNGSAIGYYGDAGSPIVTERSPAHPGFSHELCADWESAALEMEKLGTRVCLLRTSLVLGRDGGTLAKMLPAFRMGLGARLGDGQQWMAWIHIEDQVRLIRFLVSHTTLRGPFNAAAPGPVLNSEFTQTLAGVLHRPAFLAMPAPLLRAAAGEMADELLLASARVMPEAALEAGFEFRHPRLREALQDLVGR